MNFTSSNEENKSKIMEQLRSLSLSPIHDDPLDQISDASFERMEKICELMDNEEVKEKLPKFADEKEETEFIISLENYFKSQDEEVLDCESFVEAVTVIKHSSNSNFVEAVQESSDSSISNSPEVIEINDTLDEVNFLLEMTNQGISTPKCGNRKNNKFLKVPETDSRLETRYADRADMSNITLRKKRFSSSIPRLNLSPSCRTQAAVSHSPLLSPFHY